MLLSKDRQLELHELSYCHKQELEVARQCGCFYCLAVFSPARIDTWVEDKGGQTALCPECGIDSVIPSTANREFGPELLKAMHAYWFERSVVFLYRPVGTAELQLIETAGWKRFPPRLPEQPIFYPVTNENYAIQIARDWNTKHNDDKKGYVTRFAIDADYASKFERRLVGASEHEELWVPAGELTEFNRNIVGLIEVIHEFGGGQKAPQHLNLGEERV